ncbi:hypothetical protein ACTXG7_18075 [Mycolicibacterium sp. Dal123E01]|uniref:hypothetical protein n=1 Tax=Mycolicibacterium sp. Dal123E01 TaxID=3457578 RepID=UPI00403EC223
MRTTMLPLRALLLATVAASAIVAAPTTQARPLPVLCLTQNAETSCRTSDSGVDIAKPHRPVSISLTGSAS